MSLLENLKTIMDDLSIPSSASLYPDPAPDRYCVFTPIDESFLIFSDNEPTINLEEVRINLFDKNNYLSVKKEIEKKIISEGLTITDRRYVEYEKDTGYHHYAIDVAEHEIY